MTTKSIVDLCLSLFVFVALFAKANGQDAQALVEAAVSYYRGEASISTVDMTIHRPNWERVITIKAWTKGQKDSIFIILAPPKDNGNGTLKRGGEMWTYNPKVNRVIKLPPSMMSQAWMGSDFSNNDLAKSDSVIEDYTHTITGTEIYDGKKVYVIKSMPKPEAPVVWGMQKLKIREDHILLSQEFYDEDLKLVKAMTGIDPDRLREEKERAMTIDLGFAWLKLPSGREVGIVDVPGPMAYAAIVPLAVYSADVLK